MTSVETFLGYPILWARPGWETASISPFFPSTRLVLIFAFRRFEAPTGKHSDPDDRAAPIRSGTCFCRMCGRTTVWVSRFRSVRSGSRTALQQFETPARSLRESDRGRSDWADEMFGYVVGDEKEDLTQDFRDDAWGMPKSVVIDTGFDWQGDQKPGYPAAQFGHLRSARERLQQALTRSAGGIARHLCRAGQRGRPLIT